MKKQVVKKEYRDRYKQDFLSYLREQLDREYAAEGCRLLSESSINTMAKDAFYLEKNDAHDFLYWFRSNRTMGEAAKCLERLLTTRKNPENDLRCYLADMLYFRDYLRRIGSV
jgi:hypothetical protein